MSGNNYIWYASYGSNLFRKRFLCYIHGGTVEEGQDPYPGCTDKTLPVQEALIALNFELYFAETSKRWQGGGVGFIKTLRNDNVSTYGYMYLITKSQFEEVVMQEVKGDSPVPIDFDAAIKNGNYNFQGGWYGNLIWVGEKSGFPIFTFTNALPTQPFNKPSENYLRMICQGLIETHQLSQGQIVDYLIEKGGISGNYNKTELLKLTAPFFNAVKPDVKP